jgi:NADH pyrophosphatase NudC (nudix superfamily)
MTLRFKPNVTVAAVIKRADRYLLVEEETADGLMLNQPAGHLEEGESLEEAVKREVLEETAHRFTPAGLIGVYQWRAPSGTTYLRFAFAGEVGEAEVGRSLDAGIVRALWMTYAEIKAAQARLRTPAVLACIEDSLRQPHVAMDRLHSLV